MSTFTQAEINSSILLSIKKAIVGPPEYTPFDAELKRNAEKGSAEVTSIVAP